MRCKGELFGGKGDHDALLVSPTVCVSPFVIGIFAWCQVENMNGLDDSFPIWHFGKVRMSIHKTMPSRILNNKDEVKKNGKNTGFHWTSGRKERASFCVLWEDLRQEVIIDLVFVR